MRPRERVASLLAGGARGTLGGMDLGHETDATAAQLAGIRSGRGNGGSQTGRLLVVFGALLALGAGYAAWSGAFADLEVNCRVGGILAGGNKCSFTNPGGFLPGKKCVKIKLHDAKSGERASSSTVCSGLVWGGSTATAEVGYFDTPMNEVCPDGVSKCEMEIVDADAKRL